MRFKGRPNKAVKTDAIDFASVAHGCAILCATAATLLRRLPWRWQLSALHREYYEKIYLTLVSLPIVSFVCL